MHYTNPNNTITFTFNGRLKSMGRALFRTLNEYGTAPRKQIVIAMAQANFHNATESNYRDHYRGYGSVTLAHHLKHGRIKSANGVYSLTEKGKAYLKSQI